MVRQGGDPAGDRLRARVGSMLMELNTLLVGANPRDLREIIPALSSSLAHATARLLDEETRVDDTGEDRCLTMAEAARESGISERALREAGRRGDLRVIKLGRAVRIQEGTLAQWIRNHEQGRG